MRSSTRRGVTPGTPLAHRIAVLRDACAAVAILALFASAAEAQDPAAQPPPPTLAPAGGGALQLLDTEGRLADPFPLRHTNVHAEIAGNIARVSVEQEFENPFEQSIEAVYVFPLPHEAAVDDLELRIGERIVRGEIRTRSEAREIYERARDRGELAALLDQERPNIFTQHVANIQPGHVIVVRLRYVESLEHRNGGYEMVFPTVVGPRFIPGTPLGGAGPLPAAVRGSERQDSLDGASGRPAGGTGWSKDTDRVPDASRITPPVAPPGQRTGHDIEIAVDLDAGVPLEDLECPSHAVDIERPGRSRALVRLRPADTIPNKDFVLRYRVAGAAPEIGLLAHRDAASTGGYGYFSIQFQPAARVTARQARPKEMIFLLDCSGSMSGEPIARSKAAMRWAMQHLGPDDTFQIIRFSDGTSPFAPRPVPNTPANVSRGLAYLEQLQGEGGTWMLAGIQAALGTPTDPERIRIVCLLTDGYIGNETEILGAVRQLIGEARLFSFGIGSSVNRYLLDSLAEEGRGSVDYVPLDGDARPIVERFYDRIAKPYLTDIAIDWGDLDVEGVYPAPLPDLFAGQPLVLTGRYAKTGNGTIVVRGRLGREPFERRLRIVLPAHESRNAALGTLWARRRIDSLMQRMVTGEIPALVDEVTELALAHRLMTRYTSFVAVDNQVVSKDGTPMLVAQPVEMPAGVSYEGVFGELETDARREMAPSRASRSPASGGRRAAKAATPVPVPRAVPSAPQQAGGQAQLSQIGLPTPVAAPLPSPADEVQIVDRDSWSGTLQVDIEAESDHVLLGEPIRLRVTLRNVGPVAVQVPSYLTAGDLKLDLRRDGKEVSVSALLSPPHRPTSRLEPGAVRTYTLLLDGSDSRFLSAGRYDLVLTGIGGFTLVEPRARFAIVVR